ncbi:hypothetical protein MTQ01_23325 [Streptomyces sp. XM4193]|uniref:hypothetical protein n=1 Tax=Streptomyces sp. XM4193 TaxID=2929782 RepID=UPI001FFBFF13|nr:hypothetical protein [Streptomyces sp. XM4193]MCK1798903.1 hypothetical protein [Streptomyces sp. XM4193]
MSNESLQSKPAVLQTEGKNMQQVSKDFNTALTTLKNTLTGIEAGDRPPWGGDDIGSSFGALYEGFRDGMYESMGHLVGRVDDIGKGLTGMGDNHEVNEDFNDSLVKAEEARAEKLGIGKIPHLGGG